jgi:hypothetical protein
MEKDFTTSDMSSMSLVSDTPIFVDNNSYIDFNKIKFIKIFQIMCCALIFNFCFSILLYTCFYGEISNAVTFTDYFYFGITSLSTAGYGDMAPITTRTKIIVTLHLLLMYAFILSFSL